MEEISLLELWQGIRKRWAIVLVVTLVMGLVAFGVSKFVLTQKYEAGTTMIVGKPKDFANDKENNISINDVQVNQKLVSTYSEIIKTRGIAKQVIDNLKLNIDLKEFAKKVNVTTVKDTEVITVKVRDTVPQRAMDIANETSEIFRDSIKKIMNIDNVQILDAADLPLKPVSPRVTLNTAIGLIAGLFLGMMYAVIRETLDTTIKTPDDISNEFGLTVLGVIPYVKMGVNNGKKA